MRVSSLISHPILVLVALSSVVIAGCGDSTPEVTRSPQGVGGAAGHAGTAGSSANAGTAGTAAGGSAGEAGSFVGPGGTNPGGSAGSAGTAGTTPTGCGDGNVDVAAGEVCDDHNSIAGDGCSADCMTIEAGYECTMPGQPCTSTVVCGDGHISGTETCDDHNAVANDGCSATCTVEDGWICPVPGARCEAAACGDHLVAGNENCDDGNTAAGDGCDPTCRLEPGWACPPGEACHTTTCGDGISEGTEQCDDGNHDMGDGCTPFCIKEPNCTQGACTSVCGDGIRLPGDAEECEDGNTLAGDGCSPDCHIEPGFTCDPNTATVTELLLPLVLRDFKKTHPDFEEFSGVDHTIVADTLGTDGKPVYANPGGTTPTTSGQANFDQWYRDVDGVNKTVLQTMTLGMQGSTYQFATGAFFPLDGLGDVVTWGNEGNNHDFHFTSEVRYYFQYAGGERLDFTGDDDVWVFANHKRAVDLGGVHGPLSGHVILGDSNSDDTYSAAEQAETVDARFNLEKGKVYELVVFQAERHTSGSNYTLTLGNFTNSATVCVSHCGDGIVTPDEVCDDGVNDGSYGGCTAACLRADFCGDGTVQMDHEQCDDGTNLTPYSITGEGCAPGCKMPSKCGDSVVDALFGEKCDDGVNDGSYGGCTSTCQLAPRCGDGVKQDDQGEQCDDGNALSGDGCSSTCKNELQLSRFGNLTR